MNRVIDIRAYLETRTPTPASEVEQRLWLQEEVQQFTERWPPLRGDDPMPEFDWSGLQRQLVNLAGHCGRAALVPGLVSASRKRARGKPPEMVLREILILAAILQDESFTPAPSVPKTDGEGFPMP